MLENGKTLYAWLEEGAYFFVRGDMHCMAKDVDETLHAIMAKERGCSREHAAAYVAPLK